MVPKNIDIVFNSYFPALWIIRDYVMLRLVTVKKLKLANPCKRNLTCVFVNN